MQKKSVRAAGVVACLCLAISLACGPDDNARPFGREALGTSTGGNGGDTVPGGGTAGYTGMLGVLTGSGTGGAGSADGATGGTAGINGQLTGGKGGGGSRDGGTGSGGATVSGSGGAIAPGTGGTAVGGTGSATGSGGAHGSGGATGTGGVTGTGGATGRGGAIGSGGATATGGATGTGGALGTGGTMGTSAACTQHILDYDAELQKARACKAAMANVCALLVPMRLSGCGRACLTYVDKTTKLAQIETLWAMDGCTATPCPLEVCVNPVSSICSVATGLCTDL